MLRTGKLESEGKTRSSTHEDTCTSQHAQPNTTPSQSMRSLVSSSSLFFVEQPYNHYMNFDNLTMVDLQVSSNSVFISKKTSHNKNRRRVIQKSEMLRVLHLSQTQASHVLGCSLSTLKRRFYELKDELQLQKWPQFYDEFCNLPIFRHVYPMSVQYITNDSMVEEKYMDPLDLNTLSTCLCHSTEE